MSVLRICYCDCEESDYEDIEVTWAKIGEDEVSWAEPGSDEEFSLELFTIDYAELRDHGGALILGWRSNSSWFDSDRGQAQ